MWKVQEIEHMRNILYPLFLVAMELKLLSCLAVTLVMKCVKHTD